MDNLTHTLFALTLARTRLGRGGRGTTPALVLASNAPDIDIVAALGGSANYLAWHRGPTHGLLGVVGLGLTTAALVWGGGKFIEQRPKGGGQSGDTARFSTLLVVSIVGVLFHILMDLLTSYGTRLRSPFSWRWYAIDLLPIIDIYLLIVLVAGLVVGRRSAEAGRRCAAIVFVLMAVNYGGRAMAHHAALHLTERQFGATLPPACDQLALGSLVDRWPPRTVPSSGGSDPCTVDTAALPTFLSPFQWRVIAQLSDAYEIYDVDVLDSRLPAAARVPNHWTPIVLEAATTRTARSLLGFARLPQARVSADSSGGSTVVFTDMRFVTGLADPQMPRRSALFLVTVTFSSDHKIVEERLGQ